MVQICVWYDHTRMVREIVPYAYGLHTVRVWYVPYAYGTKYAYGTQQLYCADGLFT